MKEKAVLFGPERNLAGVLTFPENGNEKPGAGVIIFNAGFIHHVGPYRLHVDLARDLAAAGFPVLRFDFSGIGDSPLGNSKELDLERTKTENNAAIEIMVRHAGCEKIILLGLCSGADNAHAIAIDDARVSGVVFMDGFAYPTLLFYCKDYGPGMLKPWKWFKYGLRLMHKILTIRRKDMVGGAFFQPDLKIYERDFPPRQQVVRELQAIVDRGARLFFIYSGGIAIYYNYDKQFLHMFRSLDFKGRVVHRYFKDADHTFTNYFLRAELREEIVKWVGENF
jgi:pimeloyl-ACP methyl ester carboxylesterase